MYNKSLLKVNDDLNLSQAAIVVKYNTKKDEYTVEALHLKKGETKLEFFYENTESNAVEFVYINDKLDICCDEEGFLKFKKPVHSFKIDEFFFEIVGDFVITRNLSIQGETLFFNTNEFQDKHLLNNTIKQLKETLKKVGEIH